MGKTYKATSDAARAFLELNRGSRLTQRGAKNRLIGMAKRVDPSGNGKPFYEGHINGGGDSSIIIVSDPNDYSLLIAVVDYEMARELGYQG